MAANSAQLVALGAAAVIGYLTWSTVQTPGTFTEQEPGAVKIAVTKHSTSPPVLDERARDPFVRPGELETWGIGSGEAGAESNAPLHLAGIVLSGDVGYAYVNGVRLRVGDEYRGYRLARIAHNHVEMTNGTERFNLWLNAAAPTTAKTAPGPSADQHSYIKIVTERRGEPAAGTSAAAAPVAVPLSPSVSTAEVAGRAAAIGPSERSETAGDTFTEMPANDPTSRGR